MALNITGSGKKNSETLMSVKLSLQIILFVFSVVVFLSLLTGGALFGVAGKAINSFILGILGHSSYPLFVAVIYFTVKLFSGKNLHAKRKPVICLSILFLSAVLCYHQLTTTAFLAGAADYPSYLSACFKAGETGISGSTGGGVIFGLIVYPFYSLFGTVGSYIIFLLICSITLVLLLGGRADNKNAEPIGVKEYPSGFFDGGSANDTQAKQYILPQYENIQKSANLSDVNPPAEPEGAKGEPAEDNIVTVPKKLFVGYIDDYINAKVKKTRQSNRSFDILYTSPKPKGEPDIPVSADIQKSALGGSSYVDTFGDDFESKKKYILTPIDNILRPEADYGLGDRIFPINIGKKEPPAVKEEKPPRINHNMGGNIEIEKPKDVKDGLLSGANIINNFENTAGNRNLYENYANGINDIQSGTDNAVTPLPPQKQDIKPDFLNNLAQLRQKYVNAANEKSSFIEDAPTETPKINIRQEAPRQEAKQPNPLKFQTEISVKEDKPAIKSPYIAPSVSLMNDIFFDPNEVSENYEEKVKTLENTLNEFKVPAKVVSVTPGPAVTRYELQMPPGVPVSKLTSRANDIAMCLASNGEIRIEAPIPGKSLLGIELPNKKRQKVGLKEVIDSPEFSSNKSPVAFALGKDITGKNIICDFTKMPHLLVAGSTGSGKSVCLNTLIISIIYKSSPDDVRLILVDPKRVEFNVYNGLPHLMLKDVITDAEKAISAFNWAINEMDRRFELFKESCSKDINSYNEKAKQAKTQKLPRILIIVDELAELMMINKRELEDKIKKISQLSRAAGIHLILATQRPSVDIITGVIKANLSSRVTFKLMTQADSRTVLDCSGAEKLLGEGDMIFLASNMPKPIRLQGPYISMPEVESIVEFIKKNNEAYFDDEIEDKIMNPEADSGQSDSEEQPEEMDKYFVEALKLAIDSGQISISMVQRRFAVGYSRAGKIIDEMEKQHFITAFEGSKPRQVLITREEFNKKFGTD